MSGFLIHRILLASIGEKKGRAITFHKQTTVITGGNGTGKSTLVKSIYHAFGAEVQQKTTWKALYVKLLVHFEVNQRLYSILRDGNSFTMFDGDGTAIECFESITNGLGPYLGNLFSFHVKLTSQSRELITPPPAYLFLPFYFDQDKSWAASWNSFNRLQQLRNWKTDLIEYHAGIKPNEYYEVKGEHLQSKQDLEEVQSEMRVLKSVREQITEKSAEIDFNIDLDAFQEEIKELLVCCAKLQKAADGIKEKMVELYNEKICYDSQVEIIRTALSELNSDFHFLRTKKDHIDCPICGADYRNSFSEIFDIARDEDRCEHLLQRLNLKLEKVNSEINQMSAEHGKYSLESARIRDLLERKREQVKLADLIDSESNKKLKTVLDSKFGEINKRISEIAEKIESLKEKLKSFTSRERKKLIVDEFKAWMKAFLFNLSVHGLDEPEYSEITSAIREQGSDHPRALLAYGFSMLHVMKVHSSSVFCPMIIDSPIQQEQDTENHVRILEFIRDKRPSASQMILAVVDTKGVSFDGDVLVFEGKRNLLRAEDYEAVYSEMAPYIRKSFEIREIKRSGAAERNDGAGD